MRDIRRVGRRCEKLHIRAVDMRTDGRLGKPAGEVKRLAARPLNRIVAVIGRLLDLKENACAGGTVTAEIQNARERGVTSVVVGLPLNEDGSESVQSEKTRRFAAALEREGLSVVMEDERYTTRAARGDLLEMGVSQKRDKRKKQVDSIAAAYILESYLAKIKKGERQ